MAKGCIVQCLFSGSHIFLYASTLAHWFARLSSFWSLKAKSSFKFDLPASPRGTVDPVDFAPQTSYTLDNGQPPFISDLLWIMIYPALLPLRNNLIIAYNYTRTTSEVKLRYGKYAGHSCAGTCAPFHHYGRNCSKSCIWFGLVFDCGLRRCAIMTCTIEDHIAFILSILEKAYFRLAHGRRHVLRRPAKWL